MTDELYEHKHVISILPDDPYQLIHSKDSIYRKDENGNWYFSSSTIVPQAGQSTFDYARAPGGIATNASSLNSSKSLITLTLNNILSLLVGMIKSMQTVAVAQASRLNILVQWQKAYTEQMNSVHSFTTNNGDAFVSGTQSELTNVRQGLNLTNSTYTEQMRSNNGLVADTAKGLQTNINATQDAVNQQSNMATSILQQMSSIVQAINK